MNDFQLQTYLSLKEDENDTLGRTYQAISNFVFPYIDENNNIVGTYGDSGINKLKILLSNNYKLYKRKIESKFQSKKSFSLGYKIAPKFDLSKIEAEMLNGLLKIYIPLTKESKPKSIKIK